MLAVQPVDEAPVVERRAVRTGGEACGQLAKNGVTWLQLALRL
jgi:hypothetical protein